MKNCDHCEEKPATTKSTNPSYSGYDLCGDCARELDRREDVQAVDRREKRNSIQQAG